MTQDFGKRANSVPNTTGPVHIGLGCQLLLLGLAVVIVLFVIFAITDNSKPIEFPPMPSAPSVSGSGSESGASCGERRGSACFEREKHRPDSSRSGVSPAEFCAAEALLACSGQ